MKRVYIYALYDSRFTSDVAYVGQSEIPGKRFDTHLAGRDKTTKKWIADVKKHGGIVRMVLLESVASASADHNESRWICSLRPKLNRNGKREPVIPPQISELNPSVYWPQANRYFMSRSSETGKSFPEHSTERSR